MTGMRWWHLLWGVALFSLLLYLPTLSCRDLPDLEADELIDRLYYRSFEYFVDHQHEATGLVKDGSQWQPASTSATGFCLSALAIGAANGWISESLAERRALRAIRTCIACARSGDPRYSYHGFLYHFFDIQTGRRSVTGASRSEVSIVDHAILLIGALSAGEYFGGRVEEAALELYSLAEWDIFLDPVRNQFFGAWTPEQGFSSWHWGAYTDEILLISLLAIGSPSHPVNAKVFYDWDRTEVSVYGDEFIRSWSGALFTYQYAHLWLDLERYVDGQDVNWWDNSRCATLANRNLCIKYSDRFASYRENSWGVTPCFHPAARNCYEGRFSLMADGSGVPFHDGTVSPAGAAASLCFTPSESKAALAHYYESIPCVWGQYGFKSSFNLDQRWVAPLYFSIEVGATLLAIDAYKHGAVRSALKNCEFLNEAMRRAGFSPLCTTR